MPYGQTLLVNENQLASYVTRYRSGDQYVGKLHNIRTEASMVMLDHALADIELLMVTGATGERMVDDGVACPNEVDRAIRFREALDEDMRKTSLKTGAKQAPTLSCGPGSPVDQPDSLEHEICRTLWRWGLSRKSTNPRTTKSI